MLVVRFSQPGASFHQLQGGHGALREASSTWQDFSPATARPVASAAGRMSSSRHFRSPSHGL